MYNIKTMNHISPCGLQKLEARGCTVGENVSDPDGLILRSADLHDYAFEPSLIAIARSGAGTNNIPLEECCRRGIVVFNSPGANAEAVKEQILCSLVLSSRDVLGSIDWVKGLNGRGKDIPALVEKGKSQFAGPELMGKTLGVIGLGAIGALIANAAVSLGMTVCGYDPYLSVDAAWRLSRDVKHEVNLDGIYAKADYISINVPYTDTTYHMLDAKAFSKMKDGVRIINESRAEIVDDDAMLAAIASGRVGKYVTDFPNEKVVGVDNIIALPHLGACTPESAQREPSLLRILEHRPKNPKITVLSWRLKKSVISWRTETSKTPSTSRTRHSSAWVSAVCASCTRTCRRCSTSSSRLPAAPA